MKALPPMLEQLRRVEDLRRVSFTRERMDAAFPGLESAGFRAWVCVHYATRGGQVFIVTEEMEALVFAAHRSMPVEPVYEADLPAPRGIVLFDHQRDLLDRPGGAYAFAWTSSIGSDGIAGRSPILATALVTGSRHGFGLIPTFSASVRPGDRFYGEKPGAFEVLRAFWAISQQRLATVARLDVPRAMLRRAAKENEPPLDVRIVMLRRRAHHPGEGPAGEVSWSHRWIVSGHWRNQWIPSRGMHRHQWIMAYEKGPEDKPLLVRQTVNLLAR